LKLRIQSEQSMGTFNIIINYRELKLTKLSKLPFGPISLTVGQCELPVRGWEDFPVVILEWWIREFCASRQENNTFAFEFMETSDRLCLSYRDGNEIILSWVHNEKSQTFGNHSITQNTLEILLKNTAEKLIAYCEQRNWVNEDLLDLKRTASGIL
jgi:hypothetical protein